MPTICREVQDWVEEQIEQPIEEWITTTEKKCSDYDWWNPLGWICWIVTTLVRVVTFVLITVGKWVARVVCEVVNFVVSVAAAIVNLVLAIPVIGPILKAVIRAITAVHSYVMGQLDGLARVIGIRVTKHLRVHVIPLCEGNIPLAYQTHLMPIMEETARILYERAQIRV